MSVLDFLAEPLHLEFMVRAIATTLIASVVCALEPSTIMVLGGEPVGERFIDWNFVSSSKDRIEQAKADWRAGRFALPPDDHDEWIALPTATSASEPSPQPGAGSVPPAKAP